MQFAIPHRWRDEPICTVEIYCEDDAPMGFKLGLAVQAAVAAKISLNDARLDRARLDRAILTGAILDDASLNRAILIGASLDRANLDGAILDGANLNGASFIGASLNGASFIDASFIGASFIGASLDDATLRPFKADMWVTLAQAGRVHVADLIAKLKSGKINGSTYGEGHECACLVGTLKNSGATGLERNSNNPAERWFMSIKPGDKPGDGSVGGFYAGHALAWAEEFYALTVPAEPEAAQ